LWNVYALSLQRHQSKGVARVAREVRADLARAAEVLRQGL
jgi:hypothetical protein